MLVGASVLLNQIGGQVKCLAIDPEAAYAVCITLIPSRLRAIFLSPY
jgi:hypothetical protein